MAYVYRHIRLDKNEPFYIGIGSDDRYSRAKEKTRRSKFWQRITSKTNYRIDIIIDNISYEDAKLKEKEFISLYGRKNLGLGTLVNMTDGGDGTLNKVITDEYREKLSIAAKNRYKDNIKKKTLTPDEISKIRSERMKLKNPSLPLDKSHNFKGNVFVYKDGSLIGEFKGVIDAAKKLNICASKISACLKGKRKTNKGYTFKR